MSIKEFGVLRVRLLFIASFFAAIHMSAAAAAKKEPVQRQGRSEVSGQFVVGKLLEQRGYCSAQRDLTIRSRCFEDLVGGLFSVLSSGRYQALDQPRVIPAVEESKSVPRDSEGERVSEVNKVWGGVFRAFAALDAAINVGVSYAQYGPFLQSAATELMLAKNHAASESSNRLRKYPTGAASLLTQGLVFR
jgi:hypothetical protein